MPRKVKSVQPAPVAPVERVRARVPTHEDLLNPALTALQKLGGSASVDELDERVALAMRLPARVLEVPRGGSDTRTLFEYRMAWARNYLKNAGLITNSERGVWALTELGRKTRSVDPREISRRVRSKFQRPQQEHLEESDDRAEYLELEPAERWRTDLLRALMDLDASAFERLCQRLLREAGFIHVEVTGRTGDGGIDGNGVIRLQGLVTFPVVFQCKRYKGSVGAAAVRDLRGAMDGRSERGLLLTTGGFTRSARSEAARAGSRPIDLVDGEALVEKLRELKLGVRVVESVAVDRDFLASI